jgi:hypothetical protein
MKTQFPILRKPELNDSLGPTLSLFCIDIKNS